MKKNNLLKRIFTLCLTVLMCGVFAGCSGYINGKMQNEPYDAFEGVYLDKELSKLVTNKQSSYKIVIPKEADECEQYSANE